MKPEVKGDGSEPRGIDHLEPFPAGNSEKNAAKMGELPRLLIVASRRRVEWVAGDYSATVELDVNTPTLGVVTLVGHWTDSSASDALRRAEREALRTYDDLAADDRN